MASVSSYDEKRWRLSFFDKSKSPKRKAKYLKKKSYYKNYGYTKKQAETEAFRLEQLHKEGELDLWKSNFDSKSLTIAEAIEVWEKKAVKTHAQSTIDSMKYRMNCFKNSFGNSYMEDLPEDYVNKWINEPDKLNSRTNRRTVVNALYKSSGLTIKINVESTRAEREQAKSLDEDQWVSKKEMLAICKALPTIEGRTNLDEFSKIIQLAFFTGLRRNDIVHLRPEWISDDFTSMTIGDKNYRPKSQRKTETVALLKEAQEILKTIKLPVSYHKDFLTKKFKKAADLVCPDKNLHFHCLRHSFVMYCLDELKLPERITKQLTRHSDHRTFNRYTHNDVSNVVDFIENNV
ncbi:MAG: hypothetical protein RIE52_12175 [Balneola sp.]